MISPQNYTLPKTDLSSPKPTIRPEGFQVETTGPDIDESLTAKLTTAKEMEYLSPKINSQGELTYIDPALKRAFFQTQLKAYERWGLNLNVTSGVRAQKGSLHDLGLALDVGEYSSGFNIKQGRELVGMFSAIPGILAKYERSREESSHAYTAPHLHIYVDSSYVRSADESRHGYQFEYSQAAR